MILPARERDSATPPGLRPVPNRSATGGGWKKWEAACGVLIVGGVVLLSATQRLAADDLVDRIDDGMTFHTDDGRVRARVSGTIELEGYQFSAPAPAFIDSSGTALFNPRLTTFLDVQIGDRLYAFVQARADRGFDPSNDGLSARLDEYTVRLTPWLDGRFNLQVGKFATVVGNWVPRHGAWDNPFVNAPLPYEHLTGMWDAMPATTATTLLGWAHVLPGASRTVAPEEKYVRLPVIWGPSYATGFSVFGEYGRINYAAELKSAPLSSRPSTWESEGDRWGHPTVSGRLGYQPNPMWSFGFSGSSGPYLLAAAAPALPAGLGLGNYRQTVVGQDAGFAWHHLQVWAEVYETRFAVPRIGNADTLSYYIETKYKFTPQLFGAIRWNEQRFADFPDGAGGQRPWGNDIWRIDLAAGYRFTPHAQLKLQWSVQQERRDLGELAHLLAMQFVLRF